MDSAFATSLKDGLVSSADRPRLLRIDEIRKSLGERLVILGHHYQRPAIVRRSDIVGDSFLLAQKGASLEADWVVFCGVRFMAEAAAVLARTGQSVFHPEPGAGCPMADMADMEDVAEAWGHLTGSTGGDGLIPVVYMNSSSPLKAFVGEKGGTVCTSSNAGRAFRWAFEKGEKIFFFPDEHLGRNTALDFGIKESEISLYDFKLPGGGLDPEQIKRSKVILWSGHCHVHLLFNAADVAKARARYPGSKVVVHPECTTEVVSLSDESGSTEKIVGMVDGAGPGSTTIIGTEANLVERMALDYTDRKVLPLARSLCPNMYRVNISALLNTLESLESDTLPEPVKITDHTRSGAQIALQRMLDLPT